MQIKTVLDLQYFKSKLVVVTSLRNAWETPSFRPGEKEEGRSESVASEVYDGQGEKSKLLS